MGYSWIRRRMWAESYGIAWIVRSSCLAGSEVEARLGFFPSNRWWIWLEFSPRVNESRTNLSLSWNYNRRRKIANSGGTGLPLFLSGGWYHAACRIYIFWFYIKLLESCSGGVVVTANKCLKIYLGMWLFSLRFITILRLDRNQWMIKRFPMRQSSSPQHLERGLHPSGLALECDPYFACLFNFNGMVGGECFPL